MNYPEEVDPLAQKCLQTPLRIALLTNFIPPYRIPVFQEIAGRVASFRVLVSTLMEANRHWAVDRTSHRSPPRWAHVGGKSPARGDHAVLQPSGRDGRMVVP